MRFADNTAAGIDGDPLDEPDDEYDYSSAKSSNRRSLLDSERRREKKNSFSSALDDRYFSNVENTLQNIDSLVIPSSSSSSHKTSKTSTATPAVKPTSAASKKRAASKKDPPRPKMIHTQKTKVPVEDNGKRKTKTLITRTTPKDSPAAITSSRSRRSAVSSAKLPTANVKIEPETHSVTMDNGDDFLSKPLSEAEILMKLSRNNVKYNPDVFNDLEDILRSPVKVARSHNTITNPHNTDEFGVPATTSSGSLRFTTPAMFPERDFYLSPSRLRLESSGNDGDETESGTETEQHHRRQDDENLKAEESETDQQMADEDDDDDGDDNDSSDNDEYDDHMGFHIKQEQSNDDEYILDTHSKPTAGKAATSGYTCEMCSAVFKDRSQLLLHVPIHI